VHLHLHLRLRLCQSHISGHVSMSFDVCAVRIVGRVVLQTSFLEHLCPQVGRGRGW
jgi:hypothetical protein